MKAAAIDMPRALSVFEDGEPHTPRDVAVACQVHTLTAAWLLARLVQRGVLEMVPPQPLRRTPDMGEFRRAAP